MNARRVVARRAPAAGRTAGTLPGQTWVVGSDAFVRKYSANGEVLWTRQFGTSGWDVAALAQLGQLLGSPVRDPEI